MGHVTPAGQWQRLLTQLMGHVTPGSQWQKLLTWLMGHVTPAGQWQRLLTCLTNWCNMREVYCWVKNDHKWVIMMCVQLTMNDWPQTYCKLSVSTGTFDMCAMLRESRCRTVCYIIITVHSRVSIRSNVGQFHRVLQSCYTAGHFCETRNSEVWLGELIQLL